ncbi:unnamed protein product, partial [Ixodes persulcatus]
MGSPSVLWAVLMVSFCLATSGYGCYQVYCQPYFRTMVYRSPQPRAADLCPEAPTTCPHCVTSPEQLLQQDVCDSDYIVLARNMYRFVKPQENEEKLCGRLRILYTLAVSEVSKTFVSQDYQTSLNATCNCDVPLGDSTFYVLFKEDSVSHRHSPPSHMTLDSHVTLLQLDEPNSDKLYELKERCSKSHRVRRSEGYGLAYGGGYSSYDSYGGNSYSAPSYSAPSYSAPSYSMPSYSAPSYS